MNQEHLYDVAIIGGGPAGLTAALYLARAKYRVIVIEKEKFGGQITITSEVVNYPGIEKTSGEALTQGMKNQAQAFGTEFLLAEVDGVDFSQEIKEIHTSRGTLSAFGVIIATGAKPRMIGFDGEAKYRGHGVAYCATCDGEFFTGKEVFVVGGGFAAAEEAVFLTKYASHVTILVREEDFTCAKSVAQKAYDHPQITVCTHSEVVSVSGDQVVKKIVYLNNQTGKETVYQNDDSFGVFVFAGYQPATELFQGIVDLDEHGYVICDDHLQTNIEGVYGAGDVCIKALRQVVTATSDGANAACQLEKYASMMQKKTGWKPQIKDVPIKTDVKKDGDLFSKEILSQMAMVFDKMEKPLIFNVYLDNRPVSLELDHYLQEMVKLTDKLSIEYKDDGNQDDYPYVSILSKDHQDTGLAFHGVPGGHELTSFMIGLYNASGTGQVIDDQLMQRIQSIDREIAITIMVSLSCTMCPELVMSAQKIASINPYVRCHVYDIAHFETMKDKYQVMSVPCFVINENYVGFGKKNIEQLLDIIEDLS